MDAKLRIKREQTKRILNEVACFCEKWPGVLSAPVVKLNICPKCGKTIDVPDLGLDWRSEISDDCCYISIEVKCLECGAALTAHYNLEKISLE